MLKNYLYIFLCVHALLGNAQVNLVPNGGFEMYSTCPNNQGQVSYSIGWLEWGSADYFNTCSLNPNFNIPNNWGGYQQTSSGSAYCAIGVYLTHSLGYNIREYIQTQLISPLSVGTKYYLSFKTNLCLSTTLQVNCAIKKIGALLTVNPIAFNPPLVNSYSPHVKSNNFITDTLGWTQIFGSFIADSSYQHITLGNFYNDNNTDTLIMDGSNSCSSYYYIDDICLSTDSTFTGQFQSVDLEEINKEREVVVFFDPIVKQVIIYNNSLEDLNLKLFNSQGQIIIESISYSGHKKIVSLQDSPVGLYYTTLQSQNKITTTKIIKQ